MSGRNGLVRLRPIRAGQKEGAIRRCEFLTGSAPSDLRVFYPTVARLARLVSRESRHFVTRPTFGLCTRKVAQSSKLSREKAWKIDRCCAMQTTFGLSLALLMSNTRQNEKTSRKRHMANCSF